VIEAKGVIGMYAVVIALGIMFSTILINAQETEKKQQGGQAKAKTEEAGTANTTANPQPTTTSTTNASTTTQTITPAAATTQPTKQTAATPAAIQASQTGKQTQAPAAQTATATPSVPAKTAQQAGEQTAKPGAPVTPATAQQATKPTTSTPAAVPQVTKKIEAPKEKAAKQEEKEAPSYEKLETANLEEPSGNWLYKRIWYEKAEQKYDHIKELMSQIIEARSPFLAQRSDAEKTIFDPLYISVGMSQGELSVILSYLMNEMNKLREKQGNLTPEEREFLEVLTLHQKTLEQLHLDVQALSKLDNDLDDALQKLMERINLCRGFENQAWEHFRAIAKELSDKTARELYYTIDALDKSVNDTLKWIKGEYSEYFDKVMKTAKDQATRIEAAVKELKEKGIDFNKQHDKIEKEAAEREKEAQEQAKGKEIEKAVEQTKEELSWSYRLGTWWDSIVEGTASVFEHIGNALGSAYDLIKGLFAGSPEQPAEEEHRAPAQMKTPAPTTAASIEKPSGPEKEEQIVAPMIETQPVVPGQLEQKQLPAQPAPSASPVQSKASSDLEKVIMHHSRGAITAAMNDDCDDLNDHEFNAQLAQDIEFA